MYPTSIYESISMNDPLLEYRKEFPILDKTTYLISNSLGPMPRTVPEKLAELATETIAGALICAQIVPKSKESIN